MRGATPPVRLPYLSSYPLPSELAYNTGVHITIQRESRMISCTQIRKVRPNIWLLSLRTFLQGVGGVLKAHSDGKVCVAASWEFCSPQFIFSPRLAVSRKYADKRAFPPPSGRLEEAGAPSVESGLCFVFEDGLTTRLV